LKKIIAVVFKECVAGLPLDERYSPYNVLFPDLGNQNQFECLKATLEAVPKVLEVQQAVMGGAKLAMAEFYSQKLTSVIKSAIAEGTFNSILHNDPAKLVGLVTKLVDNLSGEQLQRAFRVIAATVAPKKRRLQRTIIASLNELVSRVPPKPSPISSGPDAEIAAIADKVAELIKSWQYTGEEKETMLRYMNFAKEIGDKEAILGLLNSSRVGAALAAGV
jgi:hypothetical protein